MSTAVKDVTVELKSINQTVEGISKDFRGLGMKYDEAKAAMQDQAKAIEEMKGAITGLEVSMQKNGQYAVQPKNAFEVPEVKALFDTVRGIETKAAVIDGPSGGYMVPNELLGYVFEALRDMDAIRANATVLTTDTSALEILTEDGDAGLEWVGELEDRNDTAAPTFGKVTIPVHDCNAVIRMTNKLIADASFPIDTYMTSKVIDRIARGEAYAFVRGDGVNQPEGLWSCDKIAAISGTAATIADDMIDMTAQLPWAMDAECAYVMNKQTEVALRKLKDSQGQYLWAPALTQGAPNTFNGFPIIRAPSAPGIASGSAPIIYGKLKDYAVVDRMGVEMIRDETSKELRRINSVEYQFNARIGGAVVRPDSFVRMEVA